MPQSGPSATVPREETGTTLRDVLTGLSGFGDDPAVLMPDGDRPRIVTYRELRDRISCQTSVLVARGIGKGDRVAMIGRNSDAWIVACLAVVSAGATAVPIDATLDRETLEHVLADCAPGLVFADSEGERISEALGHEADIVDLRKQVPGADDERQQELPQLDPADTALIFYTSGTTGPPKGVPLSHANLMFELDRLMQMGLVERGERLLLPLPLHHVYPFVVGLLTALVYGVGIVFPRSLTGPDMQTATQQGGVTTILGVPRLYDTMIDGIDRRAETAGVVAKYSYRTLTGASLFAHRRLSIPLGRILLRPVRRRVAPQLRLLASGGAALDEELAWRLDSFGWTVAAGYGLTETSPLLSVLPPGDRHFASAGRPVAGVEIRIATKDEKDETEAEASHETGEIQARGPNVFDGYLGLPDKTAEAFTEDGWFRTEDRGYIDGDGYLHVLGRSSLFVVTEAGENISLEELEKSYARHPLIREIGIFMRDGQLRAVAVPDRAALRERGGGDPQEAVESAVREQSRALPGYKRVGELAVVMDALARTLLGKIRRDKLEERFDSRRAGGAAEESGPMPVEDMSAQDRELLEAPAARAVWEWLAERYAKMRLTPDTDMRADLGIDSLEWINVTLEIRDRTGVALTEEATSRIETVRDLLEEMQELSDARQEATVDVTENPEAFLSGEQRRWLAPLGRGEVALAWILYQINRVAMRAIFRLRVRGLGNLPSGDQLVVLPNHASYIDGFVIMAALPFDFLRRTVIAGSAERAFATPVHRFAMRLARALPIRADQAAFSSLALPLVVLRDGANLIWFPEGRRSPHGGLLPVRPGIGMLLAAHPAMIVPAIIEGSFEALPPGRRIPRPHRVTVHFGQPVPADELVSKGQGDDERQRITRAVEQELKALKSTLGA